jgi:homoserine dehydrogenase
VYHLRESTWWKENGLSLVLLPDAIVESVELSKVKRKSLELAGLQLHHGFKSW